MEHIFDPKSPCSKGLGTTESYILPHIRVCVRVINRSRVRAPSWMVIQDVHYDARTAHDAHAVHVDQLEDRLTSTPFCPARRRRASFASFASFASSSSFAFVLLFFFFPRARVIETRSSFVFVLFSVCKWN